MAKTLSFNILVEEKRSDLFVAYCLELDLVATSVDCEDVQGKMKKMINRLVEFACKNQRLSDVYRPASREIWEKYRAAKRPLEQSKRAICANDGELSLLQSAYAA